MLEVTCKPIFILGNAICRENILSTIIQYGPSIGNSFVQNNHLEMAMILEEQDHPVRHQPVSLRKVMEMKILSLMKRLP